MILIGSRALMFRFPALLGRKPADYDFIAYRDEALSWLSKHSITDFEEIDGKIIAKNEPSPIEFELADNKPSSQMLIELVKADPKTISTEFGMVPNLNFLFALKKSHRFLKNSPHFWKTAADYHKMKQVGCKILPEYEEFFKLREKETYAKQAHPKLNVKKDAFFDENMNGLKLQVVHDDIHLSVKRGDKPAYEYFKKDGEEVLCDKNKFFSCSKEIQINSVREEAMVLSVERSLLPFPNGMTAKQAWLFALNKVCSSITSGWFREFAYENIFEVIKQYPEGFWEKFQEDLKNGSVRKLSG